MIFYKFYIGLHACNFVFEKNEGNLRIICKIFDIFLWTKTQPPPLYTRFLSAQKNSVIVSTLDKHRENGYNKV